MAKDKDHKQKNDDVKKQDLTPAELEAQEASELPDREAMSLINANLAVPINAAIAANILSDGSTAGAGATQADPIGQGNVVR